MDAVDKSGEELKEHAERSVGPKGLSAEEYRAAFEHAPQGIVIFDACGIAQDLNERACKIFGFEKSEAHKVHFADLFTGGQGESSLPSLLAAGRQGAVTAESVFRKKNGRTVSLSWHITGLSEGLYACSIRDITEEKKSHQSLRQSEETHRSLVETAPYPTAVFVRNKLAVANHAFKSLFPGIDTSETSHLSLAGFFGKNNERFVKQLRAVTSEGPEGLQPIAGEVSFAAADATLREYEVSAVPMLLEGKPGLQVSLVDITGRNRKTAVLEASEKKYRRLVEGSGDAMALVRDGIFLFVNTHFLSMFGYSSPDEIVGQNSDTIIAAHDRKVLLKRRRKDDRNTDVSARHEYCGVKKDGTFIQVEVQESAIEWDNRPATLGCHRDISRRKEQEIELLQRSQTLKSIHEISAAVTRSVHLDEVLLAGLRSSLKALEFEFGGIYRTETAGQTLRMVCNQSIPGNLLTPLSSQPLQEGITGYVMKTHEPLILSVASYPAHLPYGSLFASEGVETVVYVPLVAGDAVIALMVAGTRKKRKIQGNERNLVNSLGSVLGGAINNAVQYLETRESEERYRSAVENVPDIVYQAASSGSLAYVSPNITALTGYSVDDFYRTPDLWRTLIHPDDRPLYSQRLSNQASSLKSFALEYRILPKGKASYRWVRDSITYKRDGEGTLLTLTGLLSDITDRMQLQDGRAESEELKNSVIESIKEGVVVYDEALVCLEWNATMETVTGITRDQVVGKDLNDAPAQGPLDDLRPLIRQALQGVTVSSEDIALVQPREIEPRYVWARYSPLFAGDKTIRGVVGIITDVTARWRLEHEAKESEQILRNVIDGMGDALMICDLQGKVWEVNREFSRITGYQRSKVLGMDFPYPWLVDEEMAKFVKWIAALRELNELRDFDMTWKKEDGHLVAMSLNTTLLRNALGEPVAMLNIARDISDRKRLGLELEKKNSQIELLNRIISKANATLDFNEIFATIASEVYNLIRYDQINVGLLSDDGRSMTIYACHSPTGRSIPPGSVVPIENTVSKLAIGGKQGIVIGHLSEYEGLGAHTLSVEEGFESQITIPISVNERVLGTFNVVSEKRDAFSFEELAYLQPIADQIGAMIDRFRLFRRVSDDSTYIHNLLNSINSVVYTADTNHRITEVNKTWREFSHRLGLENYLDENSIIGRPLWEIIPQPELRQALEQVVPQLFERKMEYYSQEYGVKWNGDHHTYHIAVNPMVINDKVTGLVFTHSDITEIKRTEAEIKRRNKELVALNAISTSISKSLHLDEVLRVAAEQIKDMVGASLVLFYLRDERKDQLILSHSLGLPDELAAKISVLPASASASGMVISERTPLLIQKGIASDERVTPQGREVLGALGIDSLVAIPMQSKDRVLGAMDVAFLKQHDLDVQEQQLLLLIGNQIGPAIENAILYKEVQDQVQRITSLYMIGKELTGTLDVKTLLEVVYSEVSHAIPVEQFIYQSYSDQTHAFTTIFEASEGTHYYYGAAINPSRVISEKLLEYSESVLGSHPWIGGSPSGEMKGGCLMAVPVRSKQKVVGVISVAHSAPDIYAETHLRLLESIANLTEIALDKALLYEDTINKSLEIQNRNKELDDFTYVVSHDLKEPLISIEGYSKILLKDYQERIDDEGREYLGSVVQSSARLKNLIDDLLTLSRLGRTAEILQPVSVGDTITEIIHDLQFTLRERNVEVAVQPGMPTVLYNPTQLSMVFRNLISNAMKFNNKPQPRVAIGVKDLEDEFEFSVEDNGIGIERQYFDRVFMIFQRLQRSEEFRGTGAGLTIVKKIVENHKGRIWLDSTVGTGTVVFFTVPKLQVLPNSA